LEVAIAFVDFLLTLFILRVSWLRDILECSPELVALIVCVIAFQMPLTLFFEQVSEAARVLLGVIVRRTLYSRDSVVWLALVVRA
jgi:hypothetical protein